MGDSSNGDPRFIGWIFAAIGGVLLLFAMTATVLCFFAGRSLGERRRWTFCVVVAALCCFHFPFGTAIGICALIVLNRPSVKAVFAP
jgi:hypothetical protein